MSSWRPRISSCGASSGPVMPPTTASAVMASAEVLPPALPRSVGLVEPLRDDPLKAGAGVPEHPHARHGDIGSRRGEHEPVRQPAAHEFLVGAACFKPEFERRCESRSRHPTRASHHRPLGVGPQTCALRGCRSAPSGAPPALIAHQAALHAPTQLGDTDRDSTRDSSRDSSTILVAATGSTAQRHWRSFSRGCSTCNVVRSSALSDLPLQQQSRGNPRLLPVDARPPRVKRLPASPRTSREGATRGAPYGPRRAR